MTSSPIQGSSPLSRDAPNRCKEIKADGVPCGCPALVGEDYCRFHHPDKKEELQLAQKRVMTVNPQGLALNPPKTLKDLNKFLGTCVEQARAGEIPPRAAQSIAQIAKVQLDVLKELAASDKPVDVRELTRLSQNEIEKLLEQN